LDEENKGVHMYAWHTLSGSLYKKQSIPHYQISFETTNIPTICLN